MQRRKAFTLIELLVVISIVALLAALLLPALASARERVRDTACMSVLRGMMMAAASYETDHKDWLPHGAHSGNYGLWNGYNRNWYATTNFYFDFYAPQPTFGHTRHVTGVGQLMLLSYLPEVPGAFGCPQSPYREDRGYHDTIVNLDTRFPIDGYPAYTSGLDPPSGHYYRTLLTGTLTLSLRTTYAIRGPLMRMNNLRKDADWPGTTVSSSGYDKSALMQPAEMAFFADHERTKQTLIPIVGTAAGASPLLGWGRIHKYGFNVGYLDGHVGVFHDPSRVSVWSNANVRNYGSGFAMYKMDRD